MVRNLLEFKDFPLSSSTRHLGYATVTVDAWYTSAGMFRYRGPRYANENNRLPHEVTAME